MSDADLVCSRWKRFGKDRLYVETLGGVRLGWVDLLTDETHPEAPEHADAVAAAAARWKAGREVAPPSAPTPAAVATAPEAAPEPPPAPEPVAAAPAGVAQPVPVEPVEPWVDLASNRPGVAAREQAIKARAAAPVRTTLARVIGVHTSERAWRVGADGEEKVAAKLDRVVKTDPRWRVLHAIPVGRRGSDIDHILLGPGGFFTINTKSHPDGKVWVSGNTFKVNNSGVPYVRNARHEATRASDLLTRAAGFPVRVTGMIAVVNTIEFEVRSQPSGVHVVTRRGLPDWVSRLGDIHDQTTVDAVYDAARRSTTWT